MSRISQLAAARADLATQQTALVSAQSAVATAEALPLDKFTSAVDGLANFIDDSGNVAPLVNIYVSGWPNQVGPSQSILAVVGAAPFPQSRGPATIVRDAAGQIQFQTDGSEILPNPITLLVVKSNNNDLPPEVTTINIAWA